MFTFAKHWAHMDGRTLSIFIFDLVALTRHLCISIGHLQVRTCALVQSIWSHMDGRTLFIFDSVALTRHLCMSSGHFQARTCSLTQNIWYHMNGTTWSIFIFDLAALIRFVHVKWSLAGTDMFTYRAFGLTWSHMDGTTSSIVIFDLAALIRLVHVNWSLAGPDTFTFAKHLVTRGWKNIEHIHI